MGGWVYLGSDAHGAGVEVAFTHHDAAHGNQGSSGETEFFGSQQRGNNHVAARFQLAVGLELDAGTQIVENEGLLGLGNPCGWVGGKMDDIWVNESIDWLSV